MRLEIFVDHEMVHYHEPTYFNEELTDPSIWPRKKATFKFSDEWHENAATLISNFTYRSLNVDETSFEYLFLQNRQNSNLIGDQAADDNCYFSCGYKR